MADILIRGIDMPKDRSLWLLIRPDGTVFKIKDNDKLGLPKEGAAIFLPEGHGRLVDAREILEKADKSPWFDGDVSELGLLLGSEVTTIVPADGGRTMAAPTEGEGTDSSAPLRMTEREGG